MESAAYVYIDDSGCVKFGPSLFQLFSEHLDRLVAASPASAGRAGFVSQHQHRRKPYQNCAYPARKSFSFAHCSLQVLTA
jgi:hypothetical protein